MRNLTFSSYLLLFVAISFDDETEIVDLTECELNNIFFHKI